MKFCNKLSFSAKKLSEIGIGRHTKPRGREKKMELHLAKDSLVCPEEELACRILEMAIEDYRFLRSADILELRTRNYIISINEVKDFFSSDWCNGLLEFIKSKLSGGDVIKYIDKVLNEQCLEEQEND